MSKKELKEQAQTKILNQLSIIFYSLEGTEDENNEELKEEIRKQCSRIAKLYGYNGMIFQ